MSDSCIVCLGDLSIGNPETPSQSTSLAKSPRNDGNPSSATSDLNPHAPSFNNEHDNNLIAHLQPCGHDLHNECLAPWVERANSCPICRQSFHLVELTRVIGGDVLSSYVVEERTQVAELDPSMFLEIPDEEEDDGPCQACGEDDNEDVLMYCDGCQKLWHTYCAGLQEVPFGHWFCNSCRAQRDVDPRQTSQRRGQRTSRRRTRGQQRRLRSQHQTHDSGWTEVWQSVWDRLNLDLDFPYDDDDASAAVMRRHRQHTQTNRQAHEAWRRRMMVAELHGAGVPFRATETALLEPHANSLPHLRRPSPTPDAQTADEMMAWRAFDQARAADGVAATSRGKKRKSRTATPAEVEADANPEPVKRKRSSGEKLPGAPTPSNDLLRLRRNSRQPSPLSRPAMLSIDASGPSFLQSLLQEVEDSTSTNNNLPLYRPTPRNAASPGIDQYSPRPSSPALSPLPSNHSSPRAMSTTPPPLTNPRPISPTGLSSSIQPIFPPTEYSPSRGSPEPRESSADAAQTNGIQPRIPATTSQATKQKGRIPPLPDRRPPATRSRSQATSPTRAVMSLSAKADVQKLVAAALKPHYSDQKISKDEYISINKATSRMLYDQIGDLDALGVEGKAKWEKIAADEVNRAVGALKSQEVPFSTA